MANEQRQKPSYGLAPLSRVRLDELWQEMLDRVGAVVAGRQRMRRARASAVGVRVRIADRRLEPTAGIVEWAAPA